jgi:hypothetical protein
LGIQPVEVPAPNWVTFYHPTANEFYWSLLLSLSLFKPPRQHPSFFAALFHGKDLDLELAESIKLLTSNFEVASLGN